jgi:uncharacterized protein (DUF302 family)
VSVVGESIGGVVALSLAERYDVCRQAFPEREVSPMPAQRFTVERIDVTTKRTFEQATAAFEENVPAVDMGVLTRLAESQASVDEIRAAVARSQGDLELMVFAKVPQGSLTSLLGTPKKLSVYLIGNPVIANRMFERNRGAGLYAPVRVSFYEDQSGTVHFAYDRPSSLLGSFEDAEIDTVAALLDDKMATLSSRVTK